MSKLDHYLQEKKKFVDTCLHGLWDENDTPSEIFKAMKYSTMAGGKRLRPVLALAVAEMLGKPGEELWEVACALELVHTYSLVHDDLPVMDDDELRRGKPTCHVVFGEATAVLAGDALLTGAFELLARYGKREDPLIALSIIDEISQAAGPSGMIGGQLLDLQFEGEEITVEDLNKMHGLKTGALIRASVISGALTAKANAWQIESLRRFAYAAGLAFQITDDLLNISGNPSELGKNTNTDESRGKATYPLLEGEEKACQRRDQLYREALQEIKKWGDDAEIMELLTARLVYRNQ